MAKSKPAEKKATPKDSAKKDSKNKEKESEAMDKKEVANMLGTLKCSKDPDKKEMLAYYKSLPRFDGQKQELLKKWKADKSCKWFGSYKESRRQEHSTTQEEMSGFATKFLVYHIFFEIKNSW